MYPLDRRVGGRRPEGIITDTGSCAAASSGCYNCSASTAGRSYEASGCGLISGQAGSSVWVTRVFGPSGKATSKRKQMSLLPG